MRRWVERPRLLDPYLPHRPRRLVEPHVLGARHVRAWGVLLRAAVSRRRLWYRRLSERLLGPRDMQGWHVYVSERVGGPRVLNGCLPWHAAA